jgi:PPK2 family polyphosphate:nucleotide phosphotransferase
MKRYLVRPGQRVDLDDFDPGDTSRAPGGKGEAKLQLAAIVERLSEIQEMLFAEHDRKLLIVLQGMDTSGKDGTIRHVMRGFNPQGTQVVSSRKPSEEELEHDFLWRVHAKVPAKGETVVVNRSHYEDVLIVRVHDLVPKAVWQKRHDQINAFERMLCESGTVIMKFFLHISRDEQRSRLQVRIEDPKKCWKFQHGDLEERKFWKGIFEPTRMPCRRPRPSGPRGISCPPTKWYRNHLVGSIVAETLDGLHLKYPKCDVSGVVVE